MDSDTKIHGFHEGRNVVSINSDHFRINIPYDPSKPMSINQEQFRFANKEVEALRAAFDSAWQNHRFNPEERKEIGELAIKAAEAERNGRSR